MRDKQFSYEEKVDIVREHEEAHKTLKAICEEYDISKSYLCYLLKEYREKGRKAFKDTKSHTAAQKLEIIVSTPGSAGNSSIGPRQCGARYYYFQPIYRLTRALARLLLPGSILYIFP